ncbi:hypothetical protein Tco_1084080 [Tanacetum coccineum]
MSNLGRVTSSNAGSTGSASGMSRLSELSNDIVKDPKRSIASSLMMIQHGEEGDMSEYMAARPKPNDLADKGLPTSRRHTRRVSNVRVSGKTNAPHYPGLLRTKALQKDDPPSPQRIFTSTGVLPEQ